MLLQMDKLQSYGRSGLISALLLQAIYGMEVSTSIKFLNEIHKMRHPHESDIDNGQYRMPESDEQMNQIERLHETMLEIYAKNIKQ